MMTLQAVKEVVDQLSPAERAELRDYLEEQTVDVSMLRPGTMDVDALLEAAREIREGFSKEEWEEIVAAMNEEYIEPVDEDGMPLL
jgi:uncharacterized alpha-E superfamily protein